MSGNYSHSTSYPQLSPNEILNLYNQGLPSALGTTFSQAPVAANALANAAAGANPIYTASGLSQLNQYLPGYVDAGGVAANQQATNTANLLSGSGGQAAISAENLNRTINPEFYNTRATLADQTNRLFSSIGGPQLSPQEMAATERAVNQGNAATGNSGQFNPWNTVANAMNFGQALRQKQALIGNTIAQTTPLLGAVQNTNNAAGNFAVNAGNLGQNFGAALFNPNMSAPIVNAGPAFGENLFSGLISAGDTARSRSTGGGGGINASAGSSGVSCCFIFMEAYYGDMPVHVRRCRDRYYDKFPSIALGYKSMARWLVPLMQKYKIVRKFIWKFMVNPLTSHGACVLYGNYGGKKSPKLARFWFTVWNILGKL